MAGECSAQRESLPPFTRVDADGRICLSRPLTFLPIVHCASDSVVDPHPFPRSFLAFLPSLWDLFDSTRLRSIIAPDRDNQSVDQQLLRTTPVVALKCHHYRLCAWSSVESLRWTRPACSLVSSRFLPCYHGFDQSLGPGVRSDLPTTFHVVFLAMSVSVLPLICLCP